MLFPACGDDVSPGARSVLVVVAVKLSWRGAHARPAFLLSSLFETFFFVIFFDACTIEQDMSGWGVTYA